MVINRQQELLWDILYRKDVLPKYAILIRIRRYDEDLAMCSRDPFFVSRA